MPTLEGQGSEQRLKALQSRFRAASSGWRRSLAWRTVGRNLALFVFAFVAVAAVLWIMTKP